MEINFLILVTAWAHTISLPTEIFEKSPIQTVEVWNNPFPWQDPSSYPSVLEPVLSNTNLALKCSPHTLGQPFLIIRSPSLLLCSFLCLSQSHLEIHTPYWGLPHTKDLTQPSTCEDNPHTDPVWCTPGRTRHNLRFPIYLSRCPYIFPQGLSHYL